MRPESPEKPHWQWVGSKINENGMELEHDADGLFVVFTAAAIASSGNVDDAVEGSRDSAILCIVVSFTLTIPVTIVLVVT